VTALEGALAVGAAGDAYFAVRPDGGIISFGINNNGELGHGVDSPPVDYDPHPAPVVGLSAPAIGVGAVLRGQHQCAIYNDHTIACWGRNDDLELGVPDAGDQLFPALVPGAIDVVEIASGYTYTCARHVDAGVSCWGSNTSAECAQPAGSSFPSPTPVSGLGPVVQIVGSDAWFACALEQAGGVVKCWGGDMASTGRLDASIPNYLPTPVSF
jgi:alpha-tubulin suppressor-like RCC1 family protein